MILTSLESLELPWPGPRRSFTRKLQQTKLKMQRLIKARFKKARAASLLAIRRQYYLSRAYADFRVSLSRNEDIFIASTMLLLVLGFSFATTVSQIVLTFLQAATELAEMTGLDMTLLLLIVCSVLSVLFGWLASFLLNVMSLCLMDGANRKVNRSIRSTARKGLRYASRTTGAWFALVLVVAGPVGLGALLAISAVYFKLLTLSELAALFPYGATAGIAWIVFTLLQFSLVPYVALFEPTITLKQAFRRTSSLVKRHGRLFILAGYGALAGLLLAAYQLAALAKTFLRIDNLLIFAFATMATLVVANGVMTMLYRKRKLARG